MTRLNCNHLAGDETRVSVVPRKVTVKIGDAENYITKIWGYV